MCYAWRLEETMQPRGMHQLSPEWRSLYQSWSNEETVCHEGCTKQAQREGGVCHRHSLNKINTNNKKRCSQRDVPPMPGIREEFVSGTAPREVSFQTTDRRLRTVNAKEQKRRKCQIRSVERQQRMLSVK